MSELIMQDNASMVKSLCKSLLPVKIYWLTVTFRAVQVLEDEPFESLRPTLEGLLANTEKNKQRAAAEFVAGIIAG